MQWQTVATEEEREAFVMEHREVQTDAGTLKLAENAVYQDAIGETVYNSYTNVIYIFPDAVCDRLLSVGQNRYIQTKETVTFEQAKKLEALFTELYPEEPISGEGMNYYIRLKTLQVNSTIASNFSDESDDDLRSHRFDGNLSDDTFASAAFGCGTL